MNGLLADQAMQTGVPVPQGAVVYQAADGRLPHAGPGTKASWDGKTLVSLAEGLAVTTSEGVYLVEAQLHQGDVESGRTIASPGNLVVTGKVGVDAEVRAGGFLVVVGPVFSARLSATGSVTLRGGSSRTSVDAGANRQVYGTASERVRVLGNSLRKLLAVLDQLGGHPAFRTLDLQADLRPLLEILVERNFAGLPAEIAEVMRRLQPLAHVGGASTELAGLLGRRFEGRHLLQATRATVEQARLLATSTATQLTELSAAPFPIKVTAGPVLDSTLRAPGDIIVAAGDCRRSQLSGGPLVRVEGRILGGSVSAAKAIEAHAVGDDPALEVSGNGLVRLRGALGPATVRIAHLAIRLPGFRSPSIIRQVGDRLEILTETEESPHA